MSREADEAFYRGASGISSRSARRSGTNCSASVSRSSAHAIRGSLEDRDEIETAADLVKRARDRGSTIAEVAKSSPAHRCLSSNRIDNDTIGDIWIIWYCVQ